MIAYGATYPNNELVFTASDMILTIQSDGSHLSRSKARGVAGGIFYFGNKDAPTHINGAVLALSKVVDVVVSSAAEVEYASLFINGQKGVHLRNIADALGHIQPPTIMLCDNECAQGIASDTVKIKKSKSWDMRWHWIRDRVRQGQFIVVWRKGAHNLADFFAKTLPVHEHQACMPFLVHTPISINNPLHSNRGRRINAWKQSKLSC